MNKLARLLDLLSCRLFPPCPPLSAGQKHPKVALAVARAEARLIRKGRGGVIRVAVGGRVSVHLRAFGFDANTITIDDAAYFGDRAMPADRNGLPQLRLPCRPAAQLGDEEEMDCNLLTLPPAAG